MAEVILDGAHPHILIQHNTYRGTKNDTARSVPILNALIELGFDRYVARVKASGADRVFPDWMPAAGSDDEKRWSNGGIIRSFNRTVIPKMLGSSFLPDSRKPVTFHSIRGMFKAMLTIQNGLNKNIVDEVTGHAKGEMDSIYIGELTIEETYPLVHGCSYKGLLLPSSPE